MPDPLLLPLRARYLLWVEDRIESYKNRVPRSDLLCLADEVCEEIRAASPGADPITEVLLARAVDQRILLLLQLPDFRLWSRSRRTGGVMAGNFPAGS
ncbi:MAG: hypothetical protein LBG44_05170 [Gemmatimonadota bacterium]|nr:hypothetical protein [Gemmatimonadota bacterium]